MEELRKLCVFSSSRIDILRKNIDREDATLQRHTTNQSPLINTDDEDAGQSHLTLRRDAFGFWGLEGESNLLCVFTLVNSLQIARLHADRKEGEVPVFFDL